MFISFFQGEVARYKRKGKEANLEIVKLRKDLEDMKTAEIKALQVKKELMLKANVASEAAAENEDRNDPIGAGTHLTSSQERLFEADRDYIGHETIVQDMCSYLRKKGKHNPEEFLSLPVR